MSFEAYQVGTVLNLDSRDFHEKYNKVIAPFFKLEISNSSNVVIFSEESVSTDGGEGNPAYDLNGLIVTSVEWEENDCQSDMMTLTVQNPDLNMQESRLFALGNSIDLWMGYDGQIPDYMGRAIIVEVEPSFNTGSMCTLNVVAYDIAYFMMEEAKAEIDSEGTRWWERRRTPISAAEEQELNDFVTDAMRDTTEERDADRDELRMSTDPNAENVHIPDAVLDDSDALASYLREQGAANASEVDIHATRLAERQEQVNSEVEQLRQQMMESHPFELARTSAPTRGRTRRNGKVWRDKTDSEIAAAIYESYGIVPFVDTTGERGASRWVETVEETVTHRGPIFTDAHADSRSEYERNVSVQMEATGRIFTPTGVIDDIGNTHTPRLQNDPIYAYATTTEDTRQSRTIEHEGRRVIQKAGTSDWAFLKELAANHGYIVFVFYSYSHSCWIGYWGPSSNVPQIIRYNFEFNNYDESTLESFKTKESIRGQSTEIDLSYVNPRDRREYVLKVTMENLSRYAPEFRGRYAGWLNSDGIAPEGSGPEVVLTIHGQRVSVPIMRPFTDAAEARRWLMAFWIRHASEFCEAEGKLIIGIPEVHARHRHSISGVGRFSGNYFFTKVSHRMSSGSAYETTVSGYRVVEMMFDTDSPEPVSVETREIGHTREDWLRRL